jgi:queuine tRNA-ribosyltransferase subunit QTRTD1
MRGYQVPRAQRSQPRLNERAYGRLDDALQKNAEAQSGVAIPDVSADELQNTGFAEKQA